MQLEVRLQDDTVWLTQQQMSMLFNTTRNNITLHISNIFKEHELERESVCKDSLLTAQDGKTYRTKLYNLDVIISVGYRVKSQTGTRFRQWAMKILKDYMLRGYSVNQRLLHAEERIDNRLMAHEQRLEAVESKIDFFVRTSLPPKEGVLFDGQIFDAYDIAARIIRSARQRIMLIDNYIDETVLTLLDKRADGVRARIYTNHISHQLSLDIEKHNSQYAPIEVGIFDRSHDRFLCVDNTVYHLGASLKDLGKKWFAFSKMEITTDNLLTKMCCPSPEEITTDYPC